VPVGYKSSGSIDENLLDEETTKLLINMPIFDMDRNDDRQQNNNKTHFIDENSSNDPYEELLLGGCNSDTATYQDEQSGVFTDEICSVISKISHTSAEIDDVDYILDVFC